MIKIKYEIFEDHVEELKNIDLLAFDIDYTEIYGLFTITLNEHDFVPFPDDNMPLSAKRMFSEGIITHLELLNEVLTTLNQHNYVALKYIENSSSWLEFKVIKDFIKVSELEKEVNSLNSLICTNDKFLIGAKYGSFKEILVSKKEFEDEVLQKTKLFLEEIENINPLILKSKYFSKLRN